MRRTDGREGFALLAVLWALVVAAALAAELHAGIRADQRMAARARAESRARWAARAGLARAVESLRAELARAAPGGTGLAAMDTLLLPVQRTQVDGIEVVAVVTDARARLNLNTATADELAALFAALGWMDARTRADAVDRWRAARRPSRVGAGTTSRIRLRPPPGPFGAVEELRGVPGMDEAAYAAAAPHLTVASDGRINLNTASVPVLRTLPGVGAETAAALVRQRARAPLASEFDVARAVPGGPAGRAAAAVMAGVAERGAFVPREAEIRVRAGLPGAAADARIRAVAVMAGGTRLPVAPVVER